MHLLAEFLTVRKKAENKNLMLHGRNLGFSLVLVHIPLHSSTQRPFSPLFGSLTHLLTVNFWFEREDGVQSNKKGR